MAKLSEMIPVALRKQLSCIAVKTPNIALFNNTNLFTVIPQMTI